MLISQVIVGNVKLGFTKIKHIVLHCHLTQMRMVLEMDFSAILVIQKVGTDAYLR